MLHNLGGGNFQQVASNTGSVISSPGPLDAESICWGDVDDDGDLDLFVPTYPPWGGGVSNGSGNHFWTNGGAAANYAFVDTSSASGVGNPPNSARPEGAQLCDVDFDGDLDLYSNGTLYQNQSVTGTPLFVPLTEAASGIGLSTQLDEGAVLFDYDLDGDQDLVCAYTAHGVLLWENRGDGTFLREADVIECPALGSTLGISVGDWDNDGDLDLTTRSVFRRNQFVETGRRLLSIATHAIPAPHIRSATPCWVDWDRDGDLDCVLGNWAERGRLYENNTYSSSTPQPDRRFVRVRPLRDSASVVRGLDTEYGALVEVRVPEASPGRRRVQFTASSAGYLNQNEYALHFALPDDPLPTNPAEDIRFDVAVDFSSLPQNGKHRVDGHVNPALRRVNLASLTDRELQVFRSGRVRINSCDIQPSPIEDPVLSTSGGGLALPTATSSLVPLGLTPGNGWFVGLDFDTLTAAGPVRLTEVILDGMLDSPVAGPAGPFNLALWDVTAPAAPVLVAGTMMDLPIEPHNNRHRFTTDWLLAAGRRYRVVARVTMVRGSPFQGPSVDGAMNTGGGLSFRDRNPTTGVRRCPGEGRSRTALPGGACAVGDGRGLERPRQWPRRRRRAASAHWLGPAGARFALRGAVDGGTCRCQRVAGRWR